MGKFYLQTNEQDAFSGVKVQYELHATTSLSITTVSSVTQYPTELGVDVTDNIVVKNKKVSVSGVLTDVTQEGFSAVASIKSLLGKKAEGNDVKDVDSYIRELIERINRKETFDFYHSKSLDPIKNCVITSFAYSKTAELGGEAWNISLSLTEIRVANRAKFVQEPTVDWKALTEKEKSEGGGKDGAEGAKKNKVCRELWSCP